MVFRQYNSVFMKKNAEEVKRKALWETEVSEVYTWNGPKVVQVCNLSVL